jgi:hypothetical protein
MFEGLFQPMHLLVIAGSRRNCRSWAKDSDKAFGTSRPPYEMRVTKAPRSRPSLKLPFTSESRSTMRMYLK